MNEYDQIEQDIPLGDPTPPIIEQARGNGWDCAYYWFGKADDQGTDFFNPGIIERPDGPWLITRASGLHAQGFQYGQNSIIAFELDPTGKQPKRGKILKWPVDNAQQHFEDPRGFYHPGLNQTLIGCCTFLWNGPGDWTGPHQCLGAFDDDWECKKMDYPLVGGNPGSMEKITEHKNYEKNWLWFNHDNNLHLLYKADPWLVIKFGQRWSDREKYEGPTASWPYGHIRGGTTPVRVGDYYFTFHHSSLPWKGRYRRYYAGCLAFEARPPFYPKLITYQPLLSGSQNDTWAQRKPLVVFPCGSMFRDGKWTISMGVNDLKSAWVDIPHESLLKRMQPIGTDDSVIFPTMEVKSGETLKDKQRANAAKARAALAAKRAGLNGEPPLPKRRRKRRRITKPKDLAERRQKAIQEFDEAKT
jgi:predicted GH43/DUF377 family glycosyl hydrolase